MLNNFLPKKFSENSEYSLAWDVIKIWQSHDNNLCIKMMCKSAHNHKRGNQFVFPGEFGCSEEALQIAAMLQLENIFIIPHNKRKAAVSIQLLSILLVYHFHFVCNFLRQLYILQLL